MLNIDDRLLNELDESELYLVLHIAKHMKANRMTAWPSIETLSKACNWDERTVKRHRQSLIQKGFLEMNMNPGKPTLYRFLKDGIGVYRPMKTDDAIAENEGANIEGGTKNEGAQNAVKGVQKMRGVRGHKMYPEDIKDIKSEIIKKEKENAQNALTPPFAHVGSIEIPNSNIPLEAEKKENDFTGAGPGAEFIVTTVTPQASYIRLVEKVEIPETPGPKSPGEKIRELIDAGNYKIKEVFVMRGKIPQAKFDEYLTAFDTEKTGLPNLPTWKDDNDLVSNFWAWSEIRWNKERRFTHSEMRNNGRGAQLVNSGTDMGKYDQKQKF